MLTLHVGHQWDYKTLKKLGKKYAVINFIFSAQYCCEKQARQSSGVCLLFIDLWKEILQWLIKCSPMCCYFLLQIGKLINKEGDVKSSLPQANHSNLKNMT